MPARTGPSRPKPLAEIERAYMEKVLNQQEIDAMVRVARGGAATDPAAPVVSAWDARQAGQIGREQLQSINVLHEAFRPQSDP